VRDIACYQDQTMLQSYCCYEGISSSNRLTGALQVSIDAPGEFGTSCIECEDLLLSECRTICCRLSDNMSITALQDFREDVRIEKRFIHQLSSKDVPREIA